MQSAQTKITTAVREYKRLFPQEYKSFQRGRTVKIDNLKNQWATTEEDSVLERALYEIPEKLHTALKRLLTQQEMEWFQTNGSTKWFMTNFPEFNITKEY